MKLHATALILLITLAAMPLWAKEAPGHGAADYAKHLAALKKKIPSKGFTIVVQPPFVVIGDESAAAVKQPRL